MTTLTHDQATAAAKHRDTVAASLAHRLEVAKAHHDEALIRLLEHEQVLIQPDSIQPISVKPNQLPSIKHWLQRCWQGMVDAIEHQTQLQVWHSTDAQGDTWWHGYDPLTGRTVCTDSETEMRVWIEQNYQGN